MRLTAVVNGIVLGGVQTDSTQTMSQQWDIRV